MRKHVMAAMVMKQINEINMATGEIVKVAPDGVIERWHMIPSEYDQHLDTLPDGWEEFLAIRKMVIPANGWRPYPGFAWVWVDKDYNVGMMPINDTSWRVSNKMLSSAYNGTMKALIGDLRESGKIDAIMSHVYHHNIAVYTTWSGHIDMTIMVKGRKQWLGGNWLGDILLHMAAEAANVPDGRFYVANGTNKNIGQIIDYIKSGTAYDEYWAHRDADLALGCISCKRKNLEVEIAWSEIPQAKDVDIDRNNFILPDEIVNLVSRFQKETGACHTARLVAMEAIQDGYQPTEAGILDWVRDNDEWFANHNISSWRNRAIEWLTKPTDIEAMSEPCIWPEYSNVYVYAYTPSDKNGNMHKISVFLDGAKSSMIKISDIDGRNPQYFHGCGDLGYFSKASDYINAWERGDLRGI